MLLVTRLDRLARSTRDLLNTLAAIAEEGAGFRSLRDSWADTTTPQGRLMVTVLAGIAEFERELIRTRTGEGRERARARGVRLGRRPKLTPIREWKPLLAAMPESPWSKLLAPMLLRTSRFRGSVKVAVSHRPRRNEICGRSINTSYRLARAVHLHHIPSFPASSQMGHTLAFQGTAEISN